MDGNILDRDANERVYFVLTASEIVESSDLDLKGLPFAEQEERKKSFKRKAYAMGNMRYYLAFKYDANNRLRDAFAFTVISGSRGGHYEDTHPIDAQYFGDSVLKTAGIGQDRPTE